MREKIGSLLRKLPATMRFGGNEYVIEKATIPEHRNNWGEIDSHKHKISIDLAAPNGQRLAETVLHEALHGIWGDRHLPNNTQEEQAVEQLASGIIAMFIDNPWMLSWLQAALRK